MGHAHQKGIIHRDLKPGNVLVTLQDGQPAAKVIDFGIAKAMQTRLTDKTLFTELRQLIGTPEYMSPEQAETGLSDIDTGSDIYSLGALLYEMLTGTTPFDGKELRGKPFAEMQRVIREVGPTRPSMRIGELAAGSGEAVAGRRQTDARRLGQKVRGELDWIVMKCLEKDRRRRYESVSELDADLKRHLADEPVLARPPGSLYSLGKFCRRHRIGLGVACVVAVSLGLLATGAVYAAFRDARQRERHLLDLRAEQTVTLAQKKRAEDARAEAEAVNRFVEEMLEGADPFAVAPAGAGQTTTRPADTAVRDVLDGAAARLDAGRLKGQPATEAAVRTTLGRSYLGLGFYHQAEAQFRNALAIRTRLYQGDHPELAKSWINLGLALRGWRDYAGAEKAYSQAVEMQRRLFGVHRRSSVD